MSTNNYTLYFVLPLLASAASSSGSGSGTKGNWKEYCKTLKSFQDVATFNKTSSVVSAEGFVESFTIPDGWQTREEPFGIYPEPFENANGTVTLYNNGVKSKHYMSLYETITLEVQGTAKNSVNWPGTASTSVDWAAFMDYLAAGGAGVVIDLENHSTLTAEGLKTGKHYGVARPQKLYKIAIAVLHTVELTIDLPHANVFTFLGTWGLEDSGEAPLWFTRSYGPGKEEAEVSGGLSPGGSIEQDNTCLYYHSAFPLPKTSAPTPQPTEDASGAVSARSSGWLAMVSLLAAASLLTLS